MVESNDPKVSELEARRKLFFGGTCLSSPFRTVTTKCFIQAGESVTEGQDRSTALEPGLVSQMVYVLSNQLMVGKRQPLNALPTREITYV